MEQNVCRILIVDDNENIHEDIKYILSPHHANSMDSEIQSLKDELFGDESSDNKKNGTNVLSIEYKIDDAYQGEEAVKMVENSMKEGYPYSLVFMDVRMPPGMDGIQTIGKIWEVCPHVEVVICTAYSDYTWEKIVSKFGQTDHILFIKKPFDSVSLKQIALSLTTKWKLEKQGREHIENLETEVKRRTQELNGTVERLTEEVALRKDKEIQLAYIAHYDSLTGLLNRRSFYEALRNIIDKSADSEGKESFGLLFMDVDGFKQVNDLWGHDIGDLLLIEISKRIKACLGDYSYKLAGFFPADDSPKASDAIFRLGGDEFTAILTLGDREKIAELTSNLIESIKLPCFLHKHEVYTSCSVGVSLYPEDSENAKILLKNADTAMYAAKESKGAHVFFGQIKDTALMHQIALASDLGTALEKNQIDVHYQGLLNKEDQVIGITALARWNHPRFGMVMPEEFIPVAEKSNQMIKIGRSILQTACRHLKELHKAGYANLFVLVNCTNKQFYDPNFIKVIETVLKEVELDPRYLKLGLEERFSMQDPEKSLTIINSLSSMGIQFTVEGFGSSNSLFNFLRHLPQNTLIKIDKSYVENITSNDSDQIFLSNILDLIKNRNLNAIISGIETYEQEELLKNKDCIYQGYLFNIPKSFNEFIIDLKEMGRKKGNR